MNYHLHYLLIFCLKNFLQVSSFKECDYGYVFNGTNCEECGEFSIQPNVRILGGIAAIAYSWPSQALIVQKYSHTYTTRSGGQYVSERFMCGGTLISRNVVLTASHCIVKTFYFLGSDNATVRRASVVLNDAFPTMESMFQVYLGIYDTDFLKTDSEPILPGIKMSVSKIIMHPKYDSFTQLNDIALLVLSNTVDISQPEIKTACLPKPSKNFPKNSEDAYASGWGRLTPNGIIPSVLYNVRLETFDPKYCSNVLPDIEKNWETQLCAGDLDGSKDTCQGDSGGGLYVYDKSIKKYITSGITSFGESCGLVGKPGIYTRVSNYVKWIIKSLFPNDVSAPTIKEAKLRKKSLQKVFYQKKK